MKIKLARLSIIFICVSLMNCTKDEPSIPVTNYSCVVELTKDYKILKVDFYTQSILTYSKIFKHSTDQVTVNKIFNNRQFYIKSTYYLNVNGLADSCIDSSFFHNDLTDIRIYRFKYNNSYKISADVIQNGIEDDTVQISSNETVTFGITNGNTVSDFGTALNCSFFYDFTNIENKIDLNLLLGDFNGKKNTNLIKAYHSNCHIESGTQPPESNYEYMLDAGGFVIRRVENYSSSYHSNDEKPKKSKKITLYKYIFK